MWRLGQPIAEMTRSLGVSEATYYHWRKKYGQMAVAEIRQLQELAQARPRFGNCVCMCCYDARAGGSTRSGCISCIERKG